MTSLRLALAYTLSVSQEPPTLQTSSSGTSGWGTWKRILALVLDGTFSEPPPSGASLPVSPLPSSPPVPPDVPEASGLSSPLVVVYQNPPATMRPMARTAATMITVMALSLRPPPGACGWSGIVEGCG
jgi:hypothetical protein